MVKKLWLNTRENSRLSLARLIRDYHKRGDDTPKFKATVHAMNVLLHYWKLESDIEVFKEIDLIRERLDMSPRGTK